MKLVLAIFLVLSACTKSAEPVAPPVPPPPAAKQEEKPFVMCADHELCGDFRKYEDRCRKENKESDCQQFVTIFEKLAVKKDCKRSFDKDAVPSVWICDVEEQTYPSLFEKSAMTLSKLKFPFARKFYGSEAFRSTLDGAVAEAHYKKSQEVGKTLK